MTTTVERRDDAHGLAKTLVEGAAAACVQVVGPIVSHYRWQGKTQQSSEYLLVVKTTAERADATVASIVEAHPYEVPEVLVTPVVGGHDPYLRWVTENVG
ncbi:MAG TPA: divalent-cation tolerance protein CutA [Acidimicrobiales bacterium]|nr:divalent-cation tolerance protein CutA [Acidimicrobiales bacterium]